VIGLPTLIADTWLGLKLFGQVNEATFRKLVLALLFISGALAAAVLNDAQRPIARVPDLTIELFVTSAIRGLESRLTEGALRRLFGLRG
jgi:hypothetical protein